MGLERPKPISLARRVPQERDRPRVAARIRFGATGPADSPSGRFSPLGARRSSRHSARRSGIPS